MSTKFKHLTKKDKVNLIGAIRRTFTRCEYRRTVTARTTKPGYKDENRPRVTKWSMCELCKNYAPTYTIEVDHIDPVVPVNLSYDDVLESEGFDGYINRMWCDISNLQAICKDCHLNKSKEEREIRKNNRHSKKRHKQT